MMYQQMLCSDDGMSIALPHFSDARCLRETDVNDHMVKKLGDDEGDGAVADFILRATVEFTYPEGMRFPSGACVVVESGPPQIVPQGKHAVMLTLKDCYGDEVKSAQVQLLQTCLITL